jgi:signal transduction histidine kinase
MSAAAPPERSPRILVIDDEEGIRQGCVRALGAQKFQVETAGTLAEGRRLIEQASFDLVLLDIMLPDGQGTSLLKTIRARDAETVAVIITGFATVELAVDAIKQGAYDFISKPFDTDLLLMTVNQGLQKRRLTLEAGRMQNLEQEAARLARDKQEMERLDQFKSAFMLTVAHELRSPVAAAQSLLRTMLRGMAGELNDRQREVLRRVEVRHGQLLELINDLLSLAASKTYDPGQPLQPVSLTQAVRLVMEAFALQAQEKSVRIDPLSQTSDLEVQASEEGLNKVLANLVGNAVKYTPSGGQVTVGVRRQGDWAEVSVTDSGIGISSEELPRLGTEFFRAQSAKRAEIPGTGLGLSIVREQLRRFGGSLEIRSTPGQGSTFTARLPLVAR